MMIGFTGALRICTERREGIPIFPWENADAHSHFSFDGDSSSTPFIHLIGTFTLSNKSSLRDKLKARDGLGVDAETELLMSAWKTWGPAMVTHLEGRFAFALWDHDMHMGFAAVDRFGSIPIHYHASRECLLISTDLRRVVELADVPMGADRVMVAEYLLSIGDGPALANRTFFKGIKRIPPGHTLTFGAKGVQLSRYRRIPEPPAFDMDEATAVKTFRELLQAAIDRCRESGRLGLLLSGGLDSSSVAALARNESEAIPAIHFHSPHDDESAWADAVVAQGGLDLETVECLGFMDTVDDMLSATAEPWAYDNLHHDYLLLTRGGELGCTTIMGGYYGDVTICATMDYLKAWADAGDWNELFEECRKAAEIQGGSADAFLWFVAGDRFEKLARSGRWLRLLSDLRTVSRLFKIPLRALAWHFWLRSVTPKPLRRVYRIITGAERPVWWEMNRQLNPVFAESMELNQRAKRMKDAWTTPLKDAVETHENVTYHDSTAVTLTHLFALAQAANVATEHPFMDDALIQFCLSLPREFHGREGWDRWITREALKGRLTDTVRLRKDRMNYAATAFFELKHDVEHIDAFVDSWPAALNEFVDKDAFIKDWSWLKTEKELSPAAAGAGRRIRRTILLGKWLMAYG